MGTLIGAGRRLALAGAAIGVLALASGPAWAADQPRVYNLESEDLETALHEVALQSGQSILAPSRLVAGKKAPPLKGRYTAEDAVHALLVGTGLEASLVGDALVIRGPQDSVGKNNDASSQVSEIVVVGSHIKGAQPAAPVHTVDRVDIERSGYGDVGDVMRSLPENYSGGQNPGVLTGANSTSANNQNQTNASTVNLRGLGPDATLVLLNGHRMSADGELDGVDISVLPLAAIQRVDVITDGASALYGSDAVAGVVNFVMRSDFKGAELSERIGGATEGGGFVQDYTALGGQTWNGGHALASVEYLHQDSILANQRDFTSGAPPVNSLLQAETKTSVFVNLGQDLAPWVSFHLDGLYSQRRTGDLDQLEAGGLIFALGIGVQSYFVAPGLDFTLPGGWSGNLSGAASGSSDTTNYFFTGGPAFVGLDHRSQDVEASANGPVFSLPSGVIKLALGAGYRAEHFDEVDNPGTGMAGSREVTYVFGEAFAQLVQPSDDRFLLHALDLSVAGRWEHYSDFGSTANPKVGLRYKPLDGVTLRATWGTSFKAPQFLQTTLASTVYQYQAATLGGSGAGDALLTFGGNPDLKPERSTSWTAGVDWSPPAWRSLQVSATYFNIDYTNRIVEPIGSIGTALANPVNAPFIINNPSAAQQAAAIAAASVFFNTTSDPYDPANIEALVEDRFANAASQKIDGVDLSVKQNFTLNGAGELDAFANASWLHIVQQSAPGGPQQTLTGYLFNPPRLRVRAGLTWTSGPIAATGIANYISAETDNGVTPNAPIGAWTTLDLNLSYKIGRLHPRLPSLEASLSINNALDAAPPFAKGASVGAPGYSFDSTNASAIGRFIAFTLRQRL